MGAFWHLFAPVEVSITMSKREFEDKAEKEILPEPYAQDFLEINRKEWSDEHPILGTLPRMNVTYQLSDDNIAQIKPFFHEAWQIIEAEDSSIISEGLDDFIQDHLTSLDISRASLENIDEKLQEMANNYYLRFMSIPSMVVYHGWPDELLSNSHNSSMAGFTFLHSYEKMNVIPEETVLFYNLKDKIRERLSKKYTIAKYIYTLGF